MVPFLAPLLDHEREELRVLPGPSGVGFSLVPNDALEAIPERRMNDAAENVPGPRVAGEPLERGGRLARCRLRLSFGLLNVFLPFG